MTDEPLGPRSQGTSAAYILGRLRNEGRFDLAEAVESGRLSAFAAGEAAGYMKRPPVLGTGSPNQRRKRQVRLRAIEGELSPGEKMELIYGPSAAMGSCFDSREALQAAWTAARDELLGRVNPGRRPQAFYEFEWDGPRPAYDVERSTLWRADKLTPGERITLEREWKMEFAAAQPDDFTLNDGGGEILKGDCARAAHYRHHDIPRELIRRWLARARRQRGRAHGGGAAQEKALDVASKIEGEGQNLPEQSNATAAALK
jgi:hypothetical protein